ncbi:MAG TPA: FAD-dependent oxidoreductase [Candidatus Brocadiia bacterium]|nr:FAD-dependent oxidoreductase [Candidatus Brocadiia bacterium]
MIPFEKSGNGVVEPSRVLPLDGEYDVIVAGGGMAGCGAGIAAARAGCKTLIIERESALGGLATVGLVNIPLDFLSGIGAEMFRKLEEVKGLWHRNSDPEKNKLILDRMVRGAGCDVLFHTQVVEAIVKKGAICGVVVESKSGRQAILAKRVIDCSGDGDAAAMAGCDFAAGRPGDGYSQACSLEFRLGGVDWDKYVNSELKASDPRWTATIAKALEAKDLPYEIENHLNWMTHVPGRPEHCGMDEVSICICHSRKCKPLSNRDLTRMYFEGREQADTMWKFIRKHIPGFEKSWLIDTGALLGVRDGRRIAGEYTMTAWDLASGARFDDVVAISHHGYDIHHPTEPGNVKWVEMEIEGKKRPVICSAGGFNTSYFPEGGKAALCDYKGRTGADIKFPEPQFYDIPYRAMTPLKVENLLVAGRCISTTFEAQSGTRLIMLCMAMGEAAGVAMGLSLKQGIAPRKVNRVEIQRAIIANGGDLGQSKRRIPGL